MDNDGLTYAYAADSMENVRMGKIKALELDESRVNYKELVKNNSILFVPKVVGIYQVYKGNADPEKREIGGLINKVNHSYIEAFNPTGKANPDNIHSELIHVVYDPKNWGTEKLVRQMLDDRLDRVAISTPENVPKFSLKMPITVHRIFDTALRSIDPDGLDLSRIDEQALALRGKRAELYASLEPLKKSWKKYGFSQEEYLILFMMPE